MIIESFTLGPVMTNAYLIYNKENMEGIVIDPGQNPSELLKKIEELGVQIKVILLTHAHFDHIGGLEDLREVQDAEVYIHQLEKQWLMDPDLNGSGLWPGIPNISCEPANVLLEGGEVLRFLNTDIQVIHTPGHSPGSVSYIIKDIVFSGDVLFQNSIGRTDLPGGNYNVLSQSIENHFLSMPEETVVYPGHGPSTTIGLEKENNPFLR